MIFSRNDFPMDLWVPFGITRLLSSSIDSAHKTHIGIEYIGWKKGARTIPIDRMTGQQHCGRCKSFFPPLTRLVYTCMMMVVVVVTI